jgi:CRISPR system Cascade subunit CasB
MSQEKRDNFIQALEKRRSDRALLARLKRGLGQSPEDVPMAGSFTYTFSSAENPNQRDEETFHLIATLFALHPAEGGRGNMGNHLRQLWADKPEPPSNVERRFVTLLTAERDDLRDALRHAVSLLKSKEIPVNWRRLLDDVTYWNEQVKREWSRQFWYDKGQSQRPPPLIEPPDQSTDDK